MAEPVKWQDFPRLSPEEYKVESAKAGTFDPIDITKLSPEDLAARRQAAGRRAVQTGYASGNLSPEERSLYPELAGGTTGTISDYLPRFLASGARSTESTLRGFMAAGQRAINLPEAARANEAEAARLERFAAYLRPPEYNRSIFEAPSLGAAAGQALYAAGEMIPTLAATAATLPVTGPLGTAVAGSRVAAPLVGTLATRVPQFMGGGAGLAPAAAQQAGQQLLGAATTIAAGSYPTITGEIASKVRRAAEKQDREMTRGEALGVLATGVPAAIIEGVGFAPALQTARAGFGGGLANFARGTAAQSGTGAFQETTQEALGQMAARDFSGRDLLEAGVMGALVNPILERGARITSKSVDFVRSRLPSNATNDDLKRAVDDNLTAAEQAPSVPPTPEVPQGYLFGPQTEGRYFGSPNQTSAAPATELEAATVYEQRRAVVANWALADPAFAEIAATYRTGGLQPALGAISDQITQSDLTQEQIKQLQEVAKTLAWVEPAVQSGSAKQLGELPVQFKPDAPARTEPQTAAPINRAQLDLFETQGELLPRGETLTNLAGPYGVPTAARQEAGPEAAPRIAQPDLFATRAPATELEAATVYEQRRAVEELSPRNIVANVALADPAFAEIDTTYRTAGLQPALGLIRDRLAQGDLAPKQARQLQAVANTLGALEPTVQSGNAKQLVADAVVLGSLLGTSSKVITPEGKKQALSTAISRQVTELEARQKRAAEEIAAAKELGLPEQTNAQAQAALQRYGLTPKTLGELPVQFKPDAPATETIQYMRDRNEVPPGVKTLAGARYAQADTPTKLEAVAVLQAEATQLGVKRAQRLISAATPNVPPAPRRFDIAYRAVEQVRLQAQVAPKSTPAQAAPTPAAPTPAAPTPAAPTPAAPTSAATTQATPTTPAAPTRVAPAPATSAPTGAPIPQTALGLQITPAPAPAPAPALTPTIDLKANYAQTKTAQDKVKLYNAVRKVAPEGAKGEVAKGEAPSQEQFNALVDSISTPTEVTGAVSEQGAKSVPVREAPKTSRRVPKRDTQKRQAPAPAGRKKISQGQQALEARGVKDPSAKVTATANTVVSSNNRQTINDALSSNKALRENLVSEDPAVREQAEVAARAEITQQIDGRIAELEADLARQQNFVETAKTQVERDRAARTAKSIQKQLDRFAVALQENRYADAYNVLRYPSASIQRTVVEARSESQQRAFTARLKSLFASVTRAWKKPPQIMVMDYMRPDQSNPAEVALAAYVQKFVRENGDVTGLSFSPNNLPKEIGDINRNKPLAVVFSNTVSDESEALATLYEEALGHAGLRQAYGDGIDRLTKEMYRTNPAYRAAVRAMVGGDVQLYATDRVAREEVLAQMLRDGEVKASAYEKIVALIRRLGRQAGLITSYTDNDIVQIVRLAQNSVLYGTSPTTMFGAVALPPLESARSPGLRGETLSVDDSPMASSVRVLSTTMDAIGSNMQAISRLASNKRTVGAVPTQQIINTAEANGLTAARALDDNRQATKRVASTLSFMTAVVAEKYRALAPDVQAKFNNIARGSIASGINPAESFDAQLAKNPLWKSNYLLADKAKQVRFREFVDEIHTDYNDIQRSETTRAIYNDMLAASDATLAASQIAELARAFALYKQANDIATQFKIPLDPTVDVLDDLFTTQNVISKGRDDPQFMRGILTNRRDEIVAALSDKTFRDARTSDIIAGNGDMTLHDSIRRLVNNMKTMLAMNAQRPYFHAGRYGSYAVSFDMTTDLKEAQQLISALDEKGLPAFEYVPESVETGQSQPNARRVFVRLETSDQRDAYMNVLKQYPQLAGTPRTMTMSDLPAARAGAGGTEELYNRVERAISATDITDAKALDQLQTSVRRAYLDSLPKMSAQTLLTKRQGISGFESDVLRNFEHALGILGYNAAHVSGLPTKLQAFRDVSQTLRGLGDFESVPANEVAARTTQLDAMRVHSDELLRRYTNTYNPPQSTSSIYRATATARALTSSFFLAFNPSHVINNQTQTIAYGAPQLMKEFGVSYTAAAQALKGSIGVATRLTRAVAAEAYALGGMRLAANAPVLSAALDRAQLPPQQREAFVAAIASGQLESASQIHHLATLDDARDTNAWLQNGLKYASSLGAYSEFFSRAVMVAATQKLHAQSAKAAPLDVVIKRTLQESMFNYEDDNAPRWLSRQGPLGSAAPLVSPLMTYSVQATSKMLTEYATLISNDPSITADQKRAALKFIAAHSAAIAAFSGVPAIFGVQAATAVIDMVYGLLKNMFGDDDEPPDVQGAVGMWLKQVFGPQFGDAIMKGATRPLLGFDVSKRLGEADLMPFMDVLTSRRNLAETIEALQDEMTGATFSMASQVLRGMSALLKGNIMEAVKAGAPTTLRNIAKSYEMASDGYYDTKGRLVPEVTPDGVDVFWQALGYSPANIAEARERKREWDTKTKPIREQATALRRDLYQAMTANDAAQIRRITDKIAQFDRRNPDFEIASSLKTAVKQYQQKVKLSREHGTPMTVPESQIEVFKRIVGPAAYR